MIEKVINPVDNSEIVIVSGVIAKVNIFKARADDKYGNTHTAQLVMDSGEKINVQGYKSTVDTLTIQENKQWFEVKEGMTVRFPVDVNVKGSMTYYNVQRAKIKVTNKAISASLPSNSQSVSNTNATPQGQQVSVPRAIIDDSSKPASTPNSTFKVYGEVKAIKSGGIVSLLNDKDGVRYDIVLGEHSGQVFIGGVFTATIDSDGNIISGWKVYKTGKPNENIGMLRCHANNGATTLLQTEHKPITIPNLIEAAKVIHDVTGTVKEWFVQTETGSKMDEREYGNTVGNAVLNAAYISGRESLEQTAKEYLNAVVPAISSYILGESSPVEQPIVQSVEQEPINIKIETLVNSALEPDETFDIPF